MSEFPQFYGSNAWIQTRKAYAKSKGNLCERCLKKGLIVPAEIVHHKVYLTPENIEFQRKIIERSGLECPEFTLSWDNLECLCKSCHELEHSYVKKRWTVDKYGRVTARE